MAPKPGFDRAAENFLVSFFFGGNDFRAAFSESHRTQRSNPCDLLASLSGLDSGDNQTLEPHARRAGEQPE